MAAEIKPYNPVKLHYRKFGEGPPVIILHGLLGMLDNWVSFARALSTHFTVWLPDQRNHGNSPHTTAHTYALLAEDLLEFIKEHSLIGSTVIGHSMGGKTAMQLALDHPEVVGKLIVVDMGIKAYEGGHEHIFQALESVDLSQVGSRSEVDLILAEKIGDTGMRQFLMKSLHRGADGYMWKFNLSGLHQQYPEILRAISSPNPYPGPALFIRGALSGYILNSDWDGILQLFPAAHLETIGDAGHWVHADQPLLLLELITRWLG